LFRRPDCKELLNPSDREILDGVNSEWAENRFSTLMKYAPMSKRMNRGRHRFLMRRISHLLNLQRLAKLHAKGEEQIAAEFDKKKKIGASIRGNADEKDAPRSNCDANTGEVREANDFLKLIERQNLTRVDVGKALKILTSAGAKALHKGEAGKEEEKEKGKATAESSGGGGHLGEVGSKSQKKRAVRLKLREMLGQLASQGGGGGGAAAN
jgi:hypothetical protein